MNPLGDLTSFAYYILVYKFLQNQIETFQQHVLGNFTTWVAGISLILVTLWIMIQGFRLVTGRAQGSMMEFVVTSARIALICAAASTMSLFGNDLQGYLSADGGLASEISQLVSGTDSPVSQIDQNMAAAQLTMAAIDVVQVSPGNVSVAGEKDRAALIATFGAAGPAMIAGAMLLMYQFTLAIFVGFGPLFILSLIFEQTKSLFSRWLYYGIATMFSIAMLEVVSSIVLDLMLRVAGAMWASSLINTITMQTPQGFTSQAMQQGGIGLLMSTLVISIPPIAGHFFGGTVGQFVAYSQFGPSARSNANPMQPGAAAPQGSSASHQAIGQSANAGGFHTQNMNTGRTSAYANNAPVADVIKKSS